MVLHRTLAATGHAAVALILLGGCRQLDGFRTDPGESFSGSVIGTESPEDCASGECSFIRRGIPSGTHLRLTFDVRLANTVPATSPGTITTDDIRCGASTFNGTPLMPIEPLANDQLSLYEFPGVGRIQNHIYAVAPETGPFAGRDVMVFVSLMRGVHMELRAIAGPGRECDPDDCDAFARGECDLFAVWKLDKGSP